MNPDLPHHSPEELEASLTALLLGELPPEQAAGLRRAIEQDAALAALHQRLKLTIDLVREAAAHPTEQAEVQRAPLKLSERRRQQLLAHFKTVAPREFARPRRHEWASRALVGMAAVLVGMAALALLLPHFSKAKSRAMGRASDAKVVTQLSDQEAAAAANYLAAARGRSAAALRLRQPATGRVLSDAGGRPGTAHPEAESKEGLEHFDLSIRAPRVSAGSSKEVLRVPASVASGEAGGKPGPPALAARTEIVLPAAGETKYAAKESLGKEAFESSLGWLSTQREIAAADRKEAAGEETAAFGFRQRGRQAEESGLGRSLAPTPGSSQAERQAKERPPEPGAVKAGALASAGAPPSRESVGVRELANADAQDVERVLRDSFSRGPSTSEARGLGFAVQTNLLTQRSTQQMAGLPPGTTAGRRQYLASGTIGDAYFSTDPESRRVVTIADEATARAATELLAKADSAQALDQKLLETVPQGDVGGGRAGAVRSGRLGVPRENVAGGGGMMGGMGGGMGGGTPTVPKASPKPTQPTVPQAGLEASASAVANSLGTGLTVAGNRGTTTPAETTGKQTVGTPVASFTAAKAIALGIPVLGDVPLLGPGLLTNTASLSTAGGSYYGGGAYGGYSVVGPRLTREELIAQGTPAREIDAFESNIALLEVAPPGAAVTAPEGVAPASGQRGKSAVEEKGKALEQQIGGPFAVRTSPFAIREEGKALQQEIAGAQAPKLVEENKALKERAIESGEKLAEAGKYPAAAATAFARRYGLRAPGGAAPAPQAKTESDEAVRRQPAAPAAIPQPEVEARENAFSTFSLNVSDVSFKLAAASLAKGQMPEPATVRSEEFINAFDYRDPEAPPGVPVAFAWERARYPFAHNRDLLRFSLRTAAQGRQAGRALNLVLLLDNSGSMERADRVRIIHEALRVLAAQLEPSDVLSVVTFARTARLWVDGVPGNQAAQVAEEVSGLTPQGGTNLEEAMNLAYQTALRHYLANGINRVVLLTDGAANLGNVDPEALKQKVEAHRKQGVALDCFGIGWEGYNDDLLEVLSRNGDGRYGFVNTPEEAATEFAGQLAGALHVAAADVKVQVEFNPARVTVYRQVGYAKHQLTKEQFRDNSVDAAEIGAAESGNALYVIETDPRGDGPLGIVRVRYKVPGTSEYREHEWVVAYTGNAPLLEQASPALRLAATASAFSEWLVSSPFAGEVTPGRLLAYLGGVPEVYGADERPKRLEWMIRQAQSLVGK